MGWRLLAFWYRSYNIHDRSRHYLHRMLLGLFAFSDHTTSQTYGCAHVVAILGILYDIHRCPAKLSDFLVVLDQFTFVSAY